MEIMTTDAKRDLACKYMLSLDGLCYGVTTKREEYIKTILPHDSRITANYDASTMSSCALTAMSLLRVMSANHPGLHEAYNPGWVGQAPVIVYEVAEQYRAWVDPIRQPGILPQRGDIVFVGGQRYGGMEHLLICVDDASREPFVTVEGGQWDPGAGKSTAIKKQQRRIIDSRSALFVSKADPNTSALDRRIRGWVDISQMPVNIE